MAFFPNLSKYPVEPHVAKHERKQLTWFLYLCLFLLIGTALADFILSSSGKNTVPPSQQPIIAATPTPLLLLSQTPTPLPLSPYPTTPLPTKSASTPARMIVCTQEAKLCPDGKTYVSRTGPNCAFAACPVSN